MDAPVTLRLDKRMRRRIARIATKKRMSASEVIRQAVDTWVEGQEATSKPYEAMGDLIGRVRGGLPTRSTQTGRRFAEALKKRRKKK